ncbi:MAG: PEP/pyruvate-binding domain-containing protein [Chloroflexi bacterium]|nr:PEP/pyruvate-binding domain-containing protein [Chloroflexota bacterium]
MAYIIPLDQITLQAQLIAGAKAVSLGELVRAGFNVPRGFVVRASGYRDAFDLVEMDEQIAARLAQTQMDDPVELESTAKEIRAGVAGMQLPQGLVDEIETTAKKIVADSFFVVRSSLIAQDIPNPNATRVPRAHLGIPTKKIADALRQIWSILWDTRRIYFRYRKHSDARDLAIAAIIQPVIAADAAGLMFTASPHSNAPDEIHIDSTFGLGESVIAARRAPDRFVISKPTREIRARTIANKTVREVIAREGGVESVGISEVDQDAPSLTDAQLLALAELGTQIENHFHAPQDIEWCVKEGEIFILQTRAMN